MSMLKREWTDEEIKRLERDIKTAKVKVLNEWGFSVEEIVKISDLSESVVRVMLGKYC